MKIRCKCNNVIVDQHGTADFKATLIPTNLDHKVWLEPIDVMVQVVEAYSKNDFLELKKIFPNIKKLGLREFIYSVLNDVADDYGKPILECTSCGTIYIYSDFSEEYIEFIPSNKKYNRITDTTYMDESEGK